MSPVLQDDTEERARRQAAWEHRGTPWLRVHLCAAAAPRGPRRKVSYPARASEAQELPSDSLPEGRRPWEPAACLFSQSSQGRGAMACSLASEALCQAVATHSEPTLQGGGRYWPRSPPRAQSLEPSLAHSGRS